MLNDLVQYISCLTTDLYVPGHSLEAQTVHHTPRRMPAQSISWRWFSSLNLAQLLKDEESLLFHCTGTAENIIIKERIFVFALFSSTTILILLLYPVRGIVFPLLLEEYQLTVFEVNTISPLFFSLQQVDGNSYLRYIQTHVPSNLPTAPIWSFGNKQTIPILNWIYHYFQWYTSCSKHLGMLHKWVYKL